MSYHFFGGKGRWSCDHCKKILGHGHRINEVGVQVFRGDGTEFCSLPCRDTYHRPPPKKATAPKPKPKPVKKGKPTIWDDL